MNENSSDQTRHNILRHVPWRIRLTVLLLAATLALIVGGIIWQSQKHTSRLLPKHVLSQVHNLEVYFYADKVPIRYAVDQSSVTYSQGVLFIPLIKDGETITLTEQAMPSGLTHKSLQENGEAVDNTAGEATINNAEGRLIGTFISPTGKTLVLLTADNELEQTKSALKLLLRDLRRVQ